jgi:hypothetical protein
MKANESTRGLFAKRSQVDGGMSERQVVHTKEDGEYEDDFVGANWGLTG